MARSKGEEHPGSKRVIGYNITGRLLAEDEAFYKNESVFSEPDQQLKRPLHVEHEDVPRGTRMGSTKQNAPKIGALLS
jgi:hypothetical protein